MLCHWGFPVDRTTDAASTPTYKEKQMGITTIQPGAYYDANRDMFFVSASQAAYERDMMQRQMCAAQQQQAWIGDSPKPKSKPDFNDPLSFLSKADNKLLLTGEAA
jgi:hypothetical protein